MTYSKEDRINKYTTFETYESENKQISIKAKKIKL